MTEVFLDIETIPSRLPWVKEYIGGKVTHPATIKKPESIKAWEDEKKADAVEEAMRKCSFDGAMNHIICIGAAVNNEPPVSFSAKTHEDEFDVMFNFYQWLVSVYDKFGTIYVGHNITGFDLRVMRQRSIILEVLPPLGIPFNAKPWDNNPFDTMQKWDGQNKTKLDVIARALGVEGKDGVDGSMVFDMWLEGKHDEIADYCKSDVEMVRKVYNKMKGFY
jgi:predicted PolB exonuclease-like 3'-5' exonuclease